MRSVPTFVALVTATSILLMLLTAYVYPEEVALVSATRSISTLVAVDTATSSSIACPPMRSVEQPAQGQLLCMSPLAAGGFATAVPRGDPPMRSGATRAVTASLHEPLCGRRIRNGCSSW
ncbi:hypothetical protein NDU88_009005 [Pleurodeles waltl]|uniref:Secreted protein n=1 Tax=Pleurodeles waltl TaxID=8319 RepID=A0AAV7QQB3_PLEWA|nr:hypothetical protein NDU88_009005 [Pleurodeles waltl]